MNGMFGPYIEKWMRFITVKNMLLLAVTSAIIADIGLYILTLIFPKSPFFKTFIWEVIGPIELEAVPLIGYILGIVAFFAAPIYLFLDLHTKGGSGGLSTIEIFNVIIMAHLMSKQFELSPWITGISFYIVSFVFGIGGIILSMSL